MGYATAEMKRIQNEWKKIGHVPRKYSDKLWKQFKGACNHYFDRLHASKNSEYKQEEENLSKKEAVMEQLKAFNVGDDRGKDIAAIKEFIGAWKAIGNVPFKKKSINQKFHKIIDALFQKMDIQKQEAELLKYGDKIQDLAQDEDQERAIRSERLYQKENIRKQGRDHTTGKQPTILLKCI